MHTKMQRKKKKDSVLDKFIDSKLVFLISFINRKKKKKENYYCKEMPNHMH